MIEIKEEYYNGLLAEIEKTAKYKNKCIYGHDTIMQDYADARLKGLIRAYNILFNTYSMYEYCREKYIWRIVFMEKKFSKIVHRITVVTQEELGLCPAKDKKENKE